MEKDKKIRLIISVCTVLPALMVLYYFLQQIVNVFTFDLLGLNPDSHLGASVNFFFYDTIKILILLFLISSLMGVECLFSNRQTQELPYHPKAVRISVCFCLFLWSCHSFLFVLIHSAIYRFCKRRNSFGSNFFVFNNFTFSKRSGCSYVSWIVWA